jgi:hypothetical protein
MPISREQFEAGLTDDMKEWMKQIHEFLSAHKGSAYTKEELGQQVRPQISEEIVIVWKSPLDPKAGELPAPTKPVRSGPVRKEELKAFRAAVDRLVELEALERKLAGGLQYYTYKQDLPNLA